MEMNELLQSNSYIYNQVYWILQIVILKKIRKFFVYLRREVLCPQYFYNIFTTNPKWQVVTGCYYFGKKVILVLDSNLN